MPDTPGMDTNEKMTLLSNTISQAYDEGWYAYMEAETNKRNRREMRRVAWDGFISGLLFRPYGRRLRLWRERSIVEKTDIICTNLLKDADRGRRRWEREQEIDNA